VGKDGKLVSRFESKVKPDDAELTSAVEAALSK
jgi:glutathione peroxidase-family protein